MNRLDPDALEMSLENEHMEGFDVDTLLPQITCPTLLLQGNPTLGAALFDKDIEHALLLLKRGVWVQISEGGHILHQSHPGAVLNRVDQFFIEQKILSQGTA